MDESMSENTTTTGEEAKNEEGKSPALQNSFISDVSDMRFNLLNEIGRTGSFRRVGTFNQCS